MVSGLAGQCSFFVKKLAGAKVTKGTVGKRSHTRAHDEATEKQRTDRTR